MLNDPFKDPVDPRERVLSEPPIKQVDLVESAMIKLGRSPKSIERYRQHAAQQRFDRKMQQMFESEDEYAATALAKITGLEIPALREAMNLMIQENQSELRMAAREMLTKFDQKYPDRLKAFCKEVDQCESWFNRMNSNPTVQVLLQLQYTDEQYRDLLISIGAKIRCDPHSREAVLSKLDNNDALHEDRLDFDIPQPLQGEHNLTSIQFARNEIEKLRASGLTSQRTIAQHLEQLYAVGKAPLVERYVKDLLCEVESNHPWARTPSSDSSFRNMVVQSWTVEELGAKISERACDAYLSITKNGATRLLTDYTPKYGSKIEFVRSLHERVSLIQSQGLNLNPIIELYRKAPAPSKLEILDCVIEYPATLTMYRALGNNIRREQIIEALLDKREAQINLYGKKVTVLTALTPLLLNTNHAHLNFKLLCMPLSVWEQPYLHSALQALHTSPACTRTAEALIQAGISGEKHKVRLLTQLLSTPLSQKVLTTLLSDLEKLSDQSLSGIDEKLDTTSILQLINQASRSHDNKNETRSKRTADAGLDWHDDVRRKYATHADRTVQLERFEITLRQIEPALHCRIRLVAQAYPDQLDEFCSHALDFHQNSKFSLLLSDLDLFTQYLERIKKLGGINVAEEFCSLNRNKTQNDYRLLSQWLKDANEFDNLCVALTSSEDLEEVTQHQTPNQSFNRVIVVGGMYCTEKREKIASVLPEGVNLTFFEPNSNKFDLRKIDAGTLLIWSTTANSHSRHDTTRWACARANARFCYIHRSGYEALRDTLAEIFTAKS